VTDSAHTWILGISAFYHDSAACLLRDGEIVAAGSEERFTRKKGDSAFPSKAVEFCLKQGGIGLNDLSFVGFYDKPLLKFERILETYLGVAPKGFGSFLKAGPLWIKEKIYQDKMLRGALDDYDGELYYAEHHESHAASAFFPSPFEEAAILTMDGVGEWATTSLGVGKGSDLQIVKELHWPDSLGLLYSAFTYYTGFKVNSGEYKVMGLAPYGEPKYVDLIYKHLLDLKEDGSFTLDQKYFNYLGGLTMTSPAFDEIFGGPPRVSETNLTQREMDLARSVQEVCEEIMMRMARTAHRETGLDNLCLAGGVALNCVGNGKILANGPFKNIWIQPAAGDAGGALGVAQLIWHRHCAKPRTVVPGKDGMKGAYLGPEYTDSEIEQALNAVGARYVKLPRPELTTQVATHLADGRIIGWLNGRMEFGPRSLGCRSILGDPRSPKMQADMNIKIKFREGFRPFAPSVLRERVSDYFELDTDSPYMLIVAPVKKERQVPMTAEQRKLWGLELLNVPKSDIPAVTHIDYSARVQTVAADVNPDYHALLAEFERQTGCAVLVNTSFNVRGEPIVMTPLDAYRCFMRTHIDCLVLGQYLLLKGDQPEWKEEGDWRTEFQLD
jgi:carbamoyltransferase